MLRGFLTQLRPPADWTWTQQADGLIGRWSQNGHWATFSVSVAATAGQDRLDASLACPTGEIWLERPLGERRLCLRLRRGDSEMPTMQALQRLLHALSGCA